VVEGGDPKREIWLQLIQERERFVAAVCRIRKKLGIFVVCAHAPKSSQARFSFSCIIIFFPQDIINYGFLFGEISERRDKYYA
jgi:hypothetical protein